MTPSPKLWKYYLAAALIPMLVNVLATTGWLVYEYHWGDFKGLTKDQLEGENLYLVFIGMAFGNGLVFAALQTTLFLNVQPSIRDKVVLSLLCWSLLPAGWLVYIASFVDLDEGVIVWLLSTFTLPYVVANPWSFIRYRGAVKKAIAAAESTEITPEAADGPLLL